MIRASSGSAILQEDLNQRMTRKAKKRTAIPATTNVV
jgi:hypothetical protein